MKYHIHQLSKELVYIRWAGLPQPNTETEIAYLDELKSLLDQAEQPLYFISDLRQGRIVDIEILKQLAALTQHPKWAGSTAFAHNPISSIFAETFSRFAYRDKNHQEIWETPEEALAYLESIKPGVTQGIDWNSIIKPAY